MVVAPTDEEAAAIGARAWQQFDSNLTKLMRKYDLWPPNLVPSFLGDVKMANDTESLIAGSPGRVREYFEKFREESGINPPSDAECYQPLGFIDHLLAVDVLAVLPSPLAQAV